MKDMDIILVLPLGTNGAILVKALAPIFAQSPFPLMDGCLG